MKKIFLILILAYICVLNTLAQYQADRKSSDAKETGTLFKETNATPRISYTLEN